MINFAIKRVFQIIAKINWGCLLLLAIILNGGGQLSVLNVLVLSEINESVVDSIMWNTQLKSNLGFLDFDKLSGVFACYVPWTDKSTL